MRAVKYLACLSALALLAGCATEGYYDDNGNYVPPANATTSAQRNHSPNPGHDGDYYRDNDYPRHARYDSRYDYAPAAGAPYYTYDRRGYYDYNGYYLEGDVDMVPESMFPPRGMCRVWFTDRAPAAQPRIETCDNIRARVPAGAYVIYGG
jgi:hypothetical protein